MAMETTSDDYDEHLPEAYLSEECLLDEFLADENLLRPRFCRLVTPKIRNKWVEAAASCLVQALSLHCCVEIAECADCPQPLEGQQDVLDCYHDEFHSYVNLAGDIMDILETERQRHKNSMTVQLGRRGYAQYLGQMSDLAAVSMYLQHGNQLSPLLVPGVISEWFRSEFGRAEDWGLESTDHLAWWR